MRERDALYEGLFDEDCRKIAEERGCEVVFADDYTLQLDLDTDEAYDHFVFAFERLEEEEVLQSVAGWQEWRSRSGKGRHVQIALADPMPLEQRIMVQALLGSDPMRETLNLIRGRKGVAEPVRLFKPLKRDKKYDTGESLEELWGDELPF